MALDTSIRKIRRNIRDYGLAATLKKSLAALAVVVYESRTYRIYRKDIDPAAAAEEPQNHAFEMTLLKTDDASFIDQIEQMEEWLQGKVRGMIDAGSLCVLALDRSVVAGFNLISMGTVYMPIVKTSREFRPDEAWSEQITVHRDYRGRGLATILRRQAFRELAKIGVRRFYGGTLPGNIPNRKLSKKVGFREIADIRYRKILNSRIWSCSRVRDEI